MSVFSPKRIKDKKMTKLSCYILTKNSEKYLESILNKIEDISDELIIIDSGSTDNTKKITEDFENAKFISKKFLNFKNQRIFAEKQCTNNYILFLDSDEIPDSSLIQAIKKIKHEQLKKDAYKIKRTWQVLGQKVRCIYPMISPDYPIRIYNKKTTSFENSNYVHETPSGHKSIGFLSGEIQHITFESRDILNKKLQLYTNIAADDLLSKSKKITLLKIYINPISAFIKWYILKQGFRDGFIGIVLGIYAFEYTRLKYQKAYKRSLKKNLKSNSDGL